MVCSDIVRDLQITQFNLLTYFIRLFILGSINNNELSKAIAQSYSIGGTGKLCDIRDNKKYKVQNFY